MIRTKEPQNFTILLRTHTVSLQRITQRVIIRRVMSIPGKQWNIRTRLASSHRKQCGSPEALRAKKTDPPAGCSLEKSRQNQVL